MRFLSNILRKNRVLAKRKHYSIAKSSMPQLKKVRIKISGENNFLSIGENCRLQNCEIRLKGSDNKIFIEDDVVFKSGKIYLIGGSGQIIRLGKGTTVEDAYFLSDEDASIYVGEDCMLAADVLVRTGDKHSIVDQLSGKRINLSEDVVLGNHVWIGRSAQILKGSLVSSNSVVGARTLVTKKFQEENVVIAGVPGKIVRREVNWLRDLI